MSETTEVPQITGKMFLYQQPELLTREQHGDLALSPVEKPFEFAAKARALPINYTEIPAAMKIYPLIFLSADEPMLLAVTGLFDEVNLFVDDDGKWEGLIYIPAYLRRYPFGIAAENTGDRMAIVIDRAFGGLKKDAARPLFNNGEPTEDTMQAIEFCKTYERDRMMTMQFANKMKELDLIEFQSAQYTPPNSDKPIVFAQYFNIDEKKFNALSDEVINDLRKSGMLPLIYAMMMSMDNWRLLLQRRALRYNLSEEDLFKRAVN